LRYLEHGPLPQASSEKNPKSWLQQEYLSFPPEKEFVVEKDTCGQYLLPVGGQKIALIYDYEKVIDIKRNMTYYRYLNVLKLPV
jgi:hypothetical protein